MRYIIHIVFCLYWVIGLNAQTPSELFDRANSSYQNNQYQEAINTYIEILNSGKESAQLYYNMGNAYYKIDDYPSAILSYEKSLKLDRSQKDAAFNLKLANLRVADRIEPLPELFLNIWLVKFSQIASSSAWARTLICFLFLSLLGFASYLLSKTKSFRKLGFIVGLAALLLCLGSFLFAQNAYHFETAQNQAILFSENEYVKSSPDNNSTDLFIIHEGIKVTVQDEVGDWINIQLADGKEGWIPKDAVETI